MTIDKYAPILQSIAVHIVATDAKLAKSDIFSGEVLEALDISGKVDADTRAAALSQLDVVLEESRRWASITSLTGLASPEAIESSWRRMVRAEQMAERPAGEMAARVVSSEREATEAREWCEDMLHALGLEHEPSRAAATAAGLEATRLRREVAALTQTLERERAEAGIQIAANDGQSVVGAHNAAMHALEAAGYSPLGWTPARVIELLAAREAMATTASQAAGYDPECFAPARVIELLAARIADDEHPADLCTTIRGIVFEEVEAARARQDCKAVRDAAHATLRGGGALDAQAAELGLKRLLVHDGQVNEGRPTREGDDALRARMVRQLANLSGVNG